MAIERYHFTFNSQMSRLPILHNLGKKFNVVPTIERAQLSEESGWAQVSLTGDSDEIGRAIADLHLFGVLVSPANLARID